MSEKTTLNPCSAPLGLYVDGQNYSCAYDSVMTICYLSGLRTLLSGRDG